MSKALNWLVAILITACVGALAAKESKPPEPAAQLAHPPIPRGVCPRGHIGVWIEPGVTQCHKELL